MNPQYVNLAYERAILETLVRICRDELMPSDVSEEPKQRIIADDLPASINVVPEEAIYQVTQKLYRMLSKREAELARYTHTLQVDEEEEDYESEPITTKKAAEANGQESRSQRRRRKKRRTNGTGEAPSTSGAVD
jgi:hypothetical protein